MKNHGEPNEPEPADSLAAERLAKAIDQHTVEGTLFRSEAGKLRCLACGHRCLLAPGRRGVCQVRFNRDGKLMVPFGYVAGAQCDPVEKKPFFHLLPGSRAMTFGMIGCNFHCAYCQNWISSQALRDELSSPRFQVASARHLVEIACQQSARLMISSYNEPLITVEWAAAIFRHAREQGLLCGLVSNGHATPEVLEYLRPWIAALKIDLKSMNADSYRTLGGKLEHVIDTIRLASQMGIWLEVVTLLVPGFNDGHEELRRIADFLASVSVDLPWHVTAFHPDYQMTQGAPTRSEDVLRTVALGKTAGLRYVYAGNLPGNVGAWENTVCPYCQNLLVERRGFRILFNQLSPDGSCPKCKAKIPGIWNPKQEEQFAG